MSVSVPTPIVKHPIRLTRDGNLVSGAGCGWGWTPLQRKAGESHADEGAGLVRALWSAMPT